MDGWERPWAPKPITRRRPPVFNFEEADPRSFPERQQHINLLVDSIRHEDHGSGDHFNHADGRLSLEQHALGRGRHSVGELIQRGDRRTQGMLVRYNGPNRGPETIDIEATRLGLGHLKEQYGEIHTICKGLKQKFDKCTEAVDEFSLPNTLNSLWHDFMGRNSDKGFDPHLGKLKYCLQNIRTMQMHETLSPEMEALLERVLEKGSAIVCLMNKAKQDRIDFSHLLPESARAQVDADPKSETNRTVLEEIERAGERKTGKLNGKQDAGSASGKEGERNEDDSKADPGSGNGESDNEDRDIN